MLESGGEAEMTISKIFDLMFTLYDIIWIKTCLSVQLHTKRSLCYLKFWPCFISLTFRVNRKNLKLWPKYAVSRSKV